MSDATEALSADTKPSAAGAKIRRPIRAPGPLGLPPILRYTADRRTLFFTGSFFAVQAVLWLATPSSLLVTVPLVVVSGALAFMGAVATHNTIHCPVFHARWMNSLWHVVLTLTYGHPVGSYVPGHNLSHHRFTETRRDVMRTCKARFRWQPLNLLLFTASISRDILRAEFIYARAMLTRRPRWTRQLLLETGVFLGTMVALGLWDWKKLLLFVVIPHQYAAWGIVTMNLLQHDGADQNTKYNHSRNFTGALLNLFCYNNGYHTIHHAYPGMHWSLTRDAHAVLVHGKVHPALEQPSMIAYLWGAYFSPGKRVNYDGTPRVLEAPGADEAWFDLPEDRAAA
jgi:fatty acid desaturase